MVAQLLKGLIAPVTGLITKGIERRSARDDAKARLDEIMAEAAAKDASVAGQIALVNVENQNHTLKDEFALLTIALPFWIAMLAGPLGYGHLVTDMFTAMSQIPVFWQETFQYGILAALGITSVKKVLT